MTNDIFEIQDSTAVYYIVCRSCEEVFSPVRGSALWWKAKKRADKGITDAYNCSGEECGCEEPREKPDAPFRVFGYDDWLDEFDLPFDTFTAAVRAYRELRDGRTIFISGVSERVRKELDS